MSVCQASTSLAPIYRLKGSVTSRTEDNDNTLAEPKSDFVSDQSENGTSHPSHSAATSSEPQPSAPERYPDFMPSHRAELKTEILCLACLCLTVALFRFSAFANIASHFLGGYQADAGLYVWLMKSNIRDLFSLSWFNTGAYDDRRTRRPTRR